MTSETDTREAPFSLNIGIEAIRESYFVDQVADRIVDQLSDQVLTRIEDEANRIIEAKLIERVDSIVAKILDDGMATLMQPSDNFSNAKGEPITMVDFVRAKSETYLDEKVKERDGTPANGMDRGMSRMAYLMRGVVTREMEDELNNSVRAMTKEVRTQMQSAAAEWLAKFQAETATGIEKAKALSKAI